MDALPDVTPDMVTNPVVVVDGVLCLRLAGGVVPLRLGQEPVTAFLAGWHATSVYTGFTPFSILQFVSDGGEVAFWIVDAEGVRLGGSLDEMEPGARDALRDAAVPRVAQLVRAVLQEPSLTLDLRSRAFVSLPEGLRRDIGQLCAASALPPVRRVVLDAAPDAWDDDWGLSRTHVETLLATPFQDRLLLVAQDGMLSWPSPVDGRTLMVQGSLCSDDFRFAYRLADVVHGLVSYVVVSDHHAITICLYIPILRLVIFKDSWSQLLFELYVPDLSEWIIGLVCRFAPALERYLSAGSNRVASIMRGWPATHLGHQLWNEMSGIDYFLRVAKGPHIPEWIAPGLQPELWSPIDKIFTKLIGRVDRSAPNSDFAIANSYETGTCLVRITQNYVSADLRANLSRVVEADSVQNEIQQVISRRTRANEPIILLGLRVENRTMVDLVDFCEDLLDFIADKFPGATIVLDGHNSGSNGEIIVSHGELIAWQPAIVLERQIATHLKRLQVGRDITVVDIIGSPVLTSLSWCENATCFFSIWGASLAKYRWACNKPGLVVTNSWNRRHRADLHIYDSPNFMEYPSSLDFVSAELVEDFPHAPLLVNIGPGQPSFCNFRVDRPAVFSQLYNIINNATNIT